MSCRSACGVSCADAADAVTTRPTNSDAHAIRANRMVPSRSEIDVQTCSGRVCPARVESVTRGLQNGGGRPSGRADREENAFGQNLDGDGATGIGQLRGVE